MPRFGFSRHVLSRELTFRASEHDSGPCIHDPAATFQSTPAGSDGKQSPTDQEDGQSSSGLWGGLRIDKDDIITIVGALAISYFIRTYDIFYPCLTHTR